MHWGPSHCPPSTQAEPGHGAGGIPAQFSWSSTLFDSLQTGPVDEETFLKAAVEGKMKVMEKFLADGGSPDTCDQVMFFPGPAPVPASS